MSELRQIQLRRGTAANWTATNPTLLAGEIGIETDTSKIKIGDGVTAWAALGYNSPFGSRVALYPRMFGAVGGGVTDNAAAVAALIAAGEVLYDAGVRGVRIDLEGLTYGTSAPVVFGNKWNEALITGGGGFVAVGSSDDWANTSLPSGVADLAAFYAQYETATADGKTWVMRKPLMAISGTNPGFKLDGITIDGNRLAAGVYVAGNANRRGSQNVLIQNCRSYGMHIATTFEVGENTRVIGSSDISLRDGYGIVYAGLDSHFRGFTSQWAHAPLLTTGGTLFMADGDIFNGSNNPLDPIVARLWENHGNTITWRGGRIGNGQIHLWSDNLTLDGFKIGYTSTNNQTSMIRFYATSVDQGFGQFWFRPDEVPVEYRNGTATFFEFIEDDGNWNFDTTQPERYGGYLHWYARTPRIAGPQSRIALFESTSIDGIGYIEVRTNKSYATNEVRPIWGINTSGNMMWGRNSFDTLTQHWEVVNTSGNLRPMLLDADLFGSNIGSAAQRVGQVHTKELRLYDAGTTTAPYVRAVDQAMYFNTNGTDRWYIVGTSGTLRNPVSASYDIGVSGTPVKDVYLTRAIYPGEVIDASGSGTPEGAVSAPVGSTYRRTDGGAGTSFYVKESGGGNTGWIGK